MSYQALMLAAVLHGQRDVRIEQVSAPSPGPGELLLRVQTVGLCGTDLSEWAHGPRIFPIDFAHSATGHCGPLILGHEFAGTVVAVGEGVDDSWIGALVASCGITACERCLSCQAGRPNICREYAVVGLHRNGALAEYVVTPVAGSVAVDQLGLSAVEAALVQPTAIALHAMRRSNVVAGQCALVHGVGGVGAFLVHVLAASGIEVIATDLREDRLALARQLGARDTIRMGQPESDATLAAATAVCIPVVFEASGSAAVLTQTLDSARPGTTVVVVGIQKQPLPIDLAALTIREIAVIGSNSMIPEPDFQDAAELVARRRGGWSAVTGELYPLTAVADRVLIDMESGAAASVKAVIGFGDLALAEAGSA